MAFIVYVTDTGLIDSFRRTQAEADAIALKNAKLTAYQGDVDRPRWAQPKTTFFDAGDASFKPEETAPPPPTAGVEFVKMKAAQLHNQLSFWDAQVDELRLGQPSKIVGLAHDLILGARKANYIIMRHSTVSEVLRGEWVDRMGRGAGDITDARSYYARAAGLTLPDDFVAGDPVMWFNISNGAIISRTLQEAIDAQSVDFAASSKDFSTIDLLGTEWIKDITG